MMMTNVAAKYVKALIYIVVTATTWDIILVDDEMSEREMALTFEGY